MDLVQIESDIIQVAMELLNAADLKAYDAVVLGGSTSEIMGEDLGTSSSLEIGRVVVSSLVKVLKEQQIYTIIQACEHINRTLMVEEEYALRHGLEEINVVPNLSAGGGFATAGLEIFDKPVMVENVGAQAGIDIGDVFIGMHIKGVGVVVRSDIKTIGQANLSMIRTRPKLIGGPRASHF